MKNSVKKIINYIIVNGGYIWELIDNEILAIMEEIRGE